MALVLKDRVLETCNAPGTETVSLLGAATGYQTFSSAIGNANTCYYAIADQGGANWEVGIGTYTSAGNTLTRTTVLSSSNAGSLTNFSSGTQNVYVTYPSERSVNLDASNNLTVLNTTYLGGAAGNQSLQVNNVASAVNYAQIVGAVTGNAPIFSAQGTGANVSLVLTGKGTGSVVLNGTATSRTVQIDPVASGTASYMQFTKFVAVNENQMLAQGTANLGLVATGGGGIYFRTSDTSQLQATISNTTSAVNYLNFTGAATGAAPTISAQGSDANIGLVLSSKGTGVVALGGTTVANSAMQVVPTTSAVNYLTLTGGATGNGGNIAVGGTDTNANLVLKSKGSFNITLQTSNGAKMADFAPSSTGFGVNGLLLTAAGTGNAPELSAQGSDTNIDLKLTPKGTGSLTINATTAVTVPAGTTAQRPTGVTGMFRYNTTTPGFEGYNGTTWGAIGGGGSSNVTTQGLYENSATISANYTIGAGNNAVSAGPITINSGVVVTVPSSSTWVIV